MTDQQRWDSLSCYGCEAVQTPNIDRLAHEGIRFDQCYSSNPVCTPARASLMTGKPVPAHGVERLYDVLSADQPLFTHYLKQLGYQTALFGKLHVSAIKHELENRRSNDGFDVYEWCPEPSLLLSHPEQAYGRWLEREHPEFYQKLLSQGRHLTDIPQECHMTHWAAERTVEYIQSRSREEPFFCKMSVFDPHNPYHDYPKEFGDLVDAKKLRPVIKSAGPWDALPDAIRREHEHGYMLAGVTKGPAWGSAKDASGAGVKPDVDSFYTEDVLDKDRVDYLASIAFLDAEVGRVLDALEAKGILDSTLVIFCSDHGDMLGDHGLLAKGAYFYDPSVRVPLLMRWPECISRESVYHSPVQLHDLAATILQAAGCNRSFLEQIMPDSHDLLAVTHDRAREFVVCVYHGTGICDAGAYFDPPIYGAMIREARYKLNIYFVKGKPEKVIEGQLFDMWEDPHETQNLWDSDAHQSVKEGLHDKLYRWYQQHSLAVV